MAAYVEHPRLAKEHIEARGYQLEAVADCIGAPTLLVLPTALGKTPVEWMVMAERLQQHGGRALMIAPTNALVAQHLGDLQEALVTDGGSDTIISMTGSIDWRRRAKRWSSAEVIVATPQVIRNDVQRGSISLADVSILIVDEAHHATGNHASAEVGDLYLQFADNPLVLGATASPGSTVEQVEEVCRRLGLKRIHTRKADEPMLAPYAAGLQVKEVLVEVPAALREMAAPLENWLNNLVDQLRRLGYHVQTGRVTIGQLNGTRERINQAISRGEGLAYNAARQTAQAQRLLNLIGYLLCQGVAASREYLDRTERSGGEGDKGANAFITDGRIVELRRLLAKSPELHRKVGKTLDLVVEQLEASPESRVIVFAHFRDTVDEIVRRLDECDGVEPERFVGQASRDGSTGMTQKSQLKGLQRFRDGECNVLVATSVGEEGLDVPRADRVIFYEPVGSEIRTIQRRGRTGRHRAGTVHILIARDTRDEGARASALARENKMHFAISKVRRKRGRAGSDNPAESLKLFRVREGDVLGSAFGFTERERVRLAPELGAKPESRLERSVEEDSGDEQEGKSSRPDSTETEDENQGRRAEVAPNRLRPAGQVGLDAFASTDSPTRLITDSDEHEGGQPVVGDTDEADDGGLEGLAVRAAEDIVQALATEATDPLAAEGDIPCRIVVDHRELNTSIAATLRLQGVDVDVQTLPIGDFAIGDRVVIERKRVRDFVDSLLDGRLLEQAQRLVATAPRPLMLIEGRGLFTQRAVHMNALMGALATLTIDLGLPVVTTQDGEETARFLIVACRREQALLGALTKEARSRLESNSEDNPELSNWLDRQKPGGSQESEKRAASAAASVASEGKQEFDQTAMTTVILDGTAAPITAASAVDSSKRSAPITAASAVDSSKTSAPLAAAEERSRQLDRMLVLESLPSVGPATATRILEKFGSIEELSKSDEATLCEVSGIGPATAKKILDILRK
jgi:Fanconi anemia group M protein